MVEAEKKEEGRRVRLVEEVGCEDEGELLAAGDAGFEVPKHRIRACAFVNLKYPRPSNNRHKRSISESNSDVNVVA